MSVDERLESWPRRQLRDAQTRQDQYLALLAASAAMALLAALAVWNGSGTSNHRFLYVGAGLTACASLGFYIWTGASNINPLQAGVAAETRALRALTSLGLETLVWTNIQPPTWNVDLDLVVVTKTKLVVVEVKADPGRLHAESGTVVSLRRGTPHDLSHHARRAQTLAVRFKLDLIRAAKDGRLPHGIPTPHHIAAVDPLHTSPLLHSRNLCHVEALTKAIQDLPDNLPPGLREPLIHHLEDLL